MTRDEINAALKRCASEAHVLSMRFDIAKKQFDAAAFVGLAQDMQQYRETMHAVLDAQLDNFASIMTLSHKLAVLD